MMPLGRGRENAASGVFFTVPLLVAMNTKCCSSNCLTGSTALIFSPSSSGSRLTIGLPRAPRPACGSSNNPHPENLAPVGKAQQCIVGVRDEELLDEVFILDRGGRLAAPAAPLCLVVRNRLRLGI